MNGLTINDTFFNQGSIELIQQFWDNKIKIGYIPENEFTLIYNENQNNEKLFIVNSEKGYIKHMYKEIILNIPCYLTSIQNFNGLHFFNNADELQGFVTNLIESKRNDLIEEISFYKKCQRIKEFYEEKVYQIIEIFSYYPDKEYGFKVSEFPSNINYEYNFRYDLKKITLKEIAGENPLTSWCFFNEIENFEPTQIIKLLKSKIEIKK